MSGPAARVLAQGKLNLFLHVLGRDDTGYHQIETHFQRLALGDDILVRTGGVARHLDCEGADVGPVERNLAWRAALAYAAAAGWPAGFAIEVHKQLPVGGGLGGGSADAAAVLRALDALAPAALGPERLLALAGTLGADVPFLVTEAPRALAGGRGERLLALAALPERAVELLLPPFPIETRAAFAWYAQRAQRACIAPRLLERCTLDSWDGALALAGNDLEAGARAHHPALDAVLRDAPAERVRGVLLAMTGSGSACFRIAVHAAAGTAPTTRAADDTALAAPAPHGALPPHWRAVHTHTASSVVPVERME